jgi:uncharacterized protein
MHDKNSNKEVSRFFRKEFQKDPTLVEVSPLGIKPEKKAEFDKLFNWKYSDFTQQDIIAETKDKSSILKNPVVKTLFEFLRQYSGLLFRKYDSLILKEKNPWYVCTGTCDPFEKKIFVTVNGKILPCERILQSHSLGTVDNEGVHLDFKKKSEKYNCYFTKLMHQCNKCANSDSCLLCIFTLNIDAENPICDVIMNEEKFMENLSQRLSALEEMPQYYSEIMKKYQVN